MPVDRDLLRRAWPDGYLAMRGVSTIGGWQCVRVEQHESDHTTSQWLHPNGGLRKSLTSDGSVAMTAMYNQENAHTDTDDGLLPNVDPTDTATWACLLSDLTEAGSGMTMDSGVETIWAQSRPGSVWTLTWRTMSGFRGDVRFNCGDTADPAEALVHARVQLREAVK